MASQRIKALEATDDDRDRYWHSEWRRLWHPRRLLEDVRDSYYHCQIPRQSLERTITTYTGRRIKVMIWGKKP